MRTPFALAAGLLLAACASESPVEPALNRDAGVAAKSDAASDRVVVMTQNLYPGFNGDLVIAALASPDPSDDLGALAAAVETIQRTDFPARADAIADEVERARPHVIGLQEVFTIDVDLNPLGLPVVIQQDFLGILQAALAARGLQYTVAAQQQGISAVPLPFISLRDYDVLLVDADRVTVGATQAHNFTLNLGTVASGVTIKRGWVAAEGTIAGETYLFASAHPESGADFAQLRAAQALELVTALGAASPAILVGDLNDEPGSLLYQVVQGAGFTDVWRALRPGVAGLTCCHVDDLSEAVPHFDQRIDYVFARGVGFRNKPALGQITLIGDHPSDRFPGPAGPLWWSDHAGLTARFLLPASIAAR
jgi:hypothetical protein